MKAKQQKVVDKLSYENFYLENYEVIKFWALQITGNNHNLADEMVQELYLKLYRRDCPQSLESIKAYIYVSLKNAFQTQLRKNKMGKIVSLPENNDALNNLYTFDPRPILKKHDQIREICLYVCSRKETSMAASIFILKFFLGYNSDEIALITKRRKNAVEARLMKIRLEINELSNNPKRQDLHFEEKAFVRAEKFRTAGSILAELRQIIISHYSGNCPTLEEYKEIYSDEQIKPDRALVSHFVSCPRCLGRISKLLKLSSLTERLLLTTIQQITIFGLLFL